MISPSGAVVHGGKGGGKMNAVDERRWVGIRTEGGVEENVSVKSTSLTVASPGVGVRARSWLVIQGLGDRSYLAMHRSSTCGYPHVPLQNVVIECGVHPE